MCLTLAYLSGVAFAGIWAELYPLGIAICILFAFTGMVCVCLRKRAFFCAFLSMLFLGYGLAGSALMRKDEPTQAGVHLTGRVSAIVSPTRVILEEVHVENDIRLIHPAAVTLMKEADEELASVRVGQWIEGTGRLFAQDEPGNPGEIDRRIQALCSGYDLSGYILPGWTAQGDPVFSLREVFRVWREVLLEQMAQVFGEDAPLYQAVLLGERGGMEEDVLRSMRLTGTAHILTVSGLHLSLISATLEALLRRMGKSRRARMVVKATALLTFTGLTGGAPGTVRALIMSMMRDLAAIRGREYDPLTGLSLSALFMALVNPVWPLNGSYQFSFYVVFGILLLNDRVHGLMKQICPRSLRDDLAPLIGIVSISVCAQLCALPIQLRFYGYLPLLSLPMNLIGGTLTPVLMAVGALCTAVSVFSMKFATLLATVLGLIGSAFERISVRVAGMDCAIVRLPAPYAIWIVMALFLMALLSRQILWKRWTRKLWTLLAIALILLYIPRFCPQARYVQLDVGQGDAAIIRRGRSAVLVDVGPQDSYAALRYLRYEGLTVDMVFLSHLDADHAGALGTLLSSEVDIPMIAMPEDAQEEASSAAVQDALRQAQESGVNVMTLKAGDSTTALGVQFDVLSPDDSLHGSNERSLVLFATVEGVRLLLTGDLTGDSEPDTLPDCDVLKVAHHGSQYATSQALLEQTTPQAAIISVGAGNSYGHPTQCVLDDLEVIGARVFRTDRSGCITLWLRDGKWRARTYFAPRD